jgi:threonine dehydratase
MDVWVKHENQNPTGAFKVRGGLNLIARLSPQDRTRGVISATTGNHGQSIAFAAARAGVPCTLVVPINNNPAKNAMMRAWGATLIEHGRDFDDARELVERKIEDENLRYVHSANEPDLDFISLSEAQLAAGVRLALDLTHNLAEGAGGAALAAAFAHRQSLTGRRVVGVMSGGNLDVGMVARLLTTELHS